MKNETLIISAVKTTTNFVVIEFDGSIDHKAKKLSAIQSVFFTHAQAKKLGLSEKVIGYEFESKRA